MNRPLVSIVIPFFKDRRHVEFAIQSALDQMHENLQIILVDNASPDGSDEIAARFADPRIERVRLAENHGAAAGLQAGYERARGEWIGLLPADDRWLPRFVSTLMAAVADKPEVDIVFSNFRDIDDDGNVYDWPGRGGPKWKELTQEPYESGAFQDELVSFSMIHQFQTMLWRKELMWRIMPFAIGVIPCDWVMALRAFHRGAKLHFVDECLVENRVHAAQVGLSMSQTTYAKHYLFVHFSEYCFPLVRNGRPIAPRCATVVADYLESDGLFTVLERVRLLLLRQKLERGQWPFVNLKDYLEHLADNTLREHEVAAVSSLLADKARADARRIAEDAIQQESATETAKERRQLTDQIDRLSKEQQHTANAWKKWSRALKQHVQGSLGAMRRLRDLQHKSTAKRILRLLGSHRHEERHLAEGVVRRLKDTEACLHSSPPAAGDAKAPCCKDHPAISAPTRCPD
ncbi:MAG: glycosyltransferase [Verrucomicrobiaceae bacterium]|nr:glycosyltransferase [Verrucomicrobiaceae bacterium]